MAIERLTITLPAEMASAVHRTVEGGDYASASEVVREALRDWIRERDTERRDLEALRELIRAGDQSGPDSPAGEVFARLRALLLSQAKT